MATLPISRLSLNQFARETWGQVDPLVRALLAGLERGCYRIKFYKSPDDDSELVPADGFVTTGLRITPGSIIFAYLVSGTCTVQVIDENLAVLGRPHELFSEPISSLFLTNQLPTYLGVGPVPLTGAFYSFLVAPYPVVGDGLFRVDIQNTGAQQRIEFILAVLEVCKR